MRDAVGSQWFHYTLWEDWHAGLYANRQARPAVAGQVAGLLRDCDGFAFAMSEVGQGWPVATAHNLSNDYRNHRPWLGRAAGCYEYGAAIADTNMAWAMLTFAEQDAANLKTDMYCAAWRTNHMAGQLRLPI